MHWFDKEWVMEIVRENGIGTRDNDTPRYCNTASRHQLMGAVFIHAECRSEHAAANNRNADQRKQSLHRAIFAIFSMKHRQRQIHFKKLQTFLDKGVEPTTAAIL